MKPIRIYLVLLLGCLLAGTAGCGDSLTEDQKKKINEKALEKTQQTLDKWLTDLAQLVPQKQCGAAGLCGGTDGQSIECPSGCEDACNGTCNKPSRTKKFELNVDADVGGKFGQVTASFSITIELATLDHKKAKHNHKTEHDKKGKDPKEWVHWYMTFRGKTEVHGKCKVTTQTGQSVSIDLTISDEIMDVSRCEFTACGGECGPTPSPTPTTSPTPPPASPTPMPTQSPTPPPASPTPMPTQSPTPPPASPTPMPTQSPTPPPASPTPMPTQSPTPPPASPTPKMMSF